LVVWNPDYLDGLRYYAEFDMINTWKLNYSRDEDATADQLANHSLYGTDGIPLMHFKAFDSKEYSDQRQEWNITCDWPFHNGTITPQEYADCTSCFLRNISEFYTFESINNRRMTNCSLPGEWDNQNDSIYYYASIGTNLSSQGASTIDYENVMMLEIIDTTDGVNNWHDGAVVCIDIDNDQQWDDNDLCFVWWDDDGTTFYRIWNGTEIKYYGYSPEENCSARFWANYSSCPYDWVASTISGESNALLPSLHRYSNHRVYSMWVPCNYFVKEDGTYLNTTDTFGLSIMTIDSGINGVPLQEEIVVWQDYNETSGGNYLSNNTNGSDYWNEMLNVTSYTDIENFYIYGTDWNGVNASHMQYWAHGRLGNETGYLKQDYYILNISKFSNVSELRNASKVQYANFTIRLYNNGSLEYNLTNITVNETFPDGVEIIYTNATDYWNPGGNSYEFNVTWLNSSNVTEIIIAVNITENALPNGSIWNNYAFATAEQPGTSTYDTCLIYYGANNAPVINWTYPANNSNPSLILDNISCYVYDGDGDNMDVYFFSNKSGWGTQTDTWTTLYNGIGTNSTVTDGYYRSNQTFNKTDEYNTRWRWGGTIYKWSVNVTDGKVWTNETFYYTTSSSRYDVTTSNDVVSADAYKVWTFRAGEGNYYGIYDVNGGGDVTATDAYLVWANRN